MTLVTMIKNEVLSHSEHESQTILPSTSKICFAQCDLQWDEELSAKFLCRICRKTFYNETALQNHVKMQHDSEDVKFHEPHTKSFIDQNFNDLCGFKFVSLENDDSSSDTPVHGGLTSRVFSQDTSYLIVKVDGTDVDMEVIKQVKELGGIKRSNVKIGKPPVDLRGPFTCTFPSTVRPDLQCRQVFFNCCDYSLHYREEHTKRRKAALRCQVCEKRLDRETCPRDSLTNQLQVFNTITFSCRICGQTFLDNKQFDEHNRLMHAKMKPYQCAICTKRFTQQGGLQQHMRMHTGIRPFACTFCPKAFTQKAGLDQHLRTHTKIKPFKCVICTKSFSQSVHLRQHMRTHTNIQPFECAVCGRRFKQSSHLNFHMRSHVGADASLLIDNYTRDVRHSDQIDFLNFSNLQPIQDGETLYYAAELARGPLHTQNPYYEPHSILSTVNFISDN